MMPAKYANLAGIYFLEPYQPGKIPLVLIHGTQTGMMTWGDLINDLRMNPWFVQKYQVWLFTYPTGEPYLESAHTLRTALQEVRGTFDPQCADTALSEMVLAGHSQGGMLVKPMVTWSDDKITRAVFRVPFDRLNLSPEERERLSNFLIFEPQDCVKRAIYICTPFTGVTLIVPPTETPGVALTGTMITCTALLVARLPKASTSCTWSGGVCTLPETPVVGCVRNERDATAAGLTVTEAVPVPILALAASLTEMDCGPAVSSIRPGKVLVP